MEKRKNDEQEKIQTANNMIDVKDVKKNILYTKSDYLIGYLRLMPINIELLSKRELESLCNILAGGFKSIDFPFSILSIPRSVDLESYIAFLNQSYEEEIENQHRKALLRIMLKEASEKVMNDSNYEHQFFIKVWEEKSSNEYVEAKLAQKLENIAGRYALVQNETKRLNDEEIIKLCNLFANNSTAVFENYEDATYTPIPIIK